jgi:hypothetical protein
MESRPLRPRVSARLLRRFALDGHAVAEALEALGQGGLTAGDPHLSAAERAQHAAAQGAPAPRAFRAPPADHACVDHGQQVRAARHQAKAAAGVLRA